MLNIKMTFPGYGTVKLVKIDGERGPMWNAEVSSDKLAWALSRTQDNGRDQERSRKWRSEIYEAMAPEDGNCTFDITRDGYRI